MSDAVKGKNGDGRVGFDHEPEGVTLAIEAEVDVDPDPGFERRLDELYRRVRELPPGSDEETQDELGLLLQLLPAVERTGDCALLHNIEIAVQSLLANPPNRLVAIRLREAAQQRIIRRSFLRSILPGNSASTWVISGLAALLYFAIPFTVAIVMLLDLGDWGFAIAIAIAGAIGSVISILVRISDFSEIRILNPPALFWTGFFKPVIGAAFALFVFVAFESQLVNVNEGVDHQFMYLTLGFVAGFSERFAPDLVSHLEGGFGELRGPVRSESARS